jgi:SulP family sulfate permease
MKRLISLKNSDSLVLILVILLTIFANLLVAVGVGMVLSSFFFMQRMGEIVDEQSKQGNISEMEKKLKIPDSIKDRIFEYELDGPLFYGFSDQFKEQAEAIVGKDAVIINMSHVPYIDASGIYVLEEVIQHFKEKKIEVVLVGVKDHIFKQFEELKVIPKTLPEEKAYNSVRAGLKYLKFQLENPS